MDRGVVPLPGFYPRHPAGDFVRQGLVWSPDVQSWLPRQDAPSGHRPWTPVAVVDGGTAFRNSYGPAIHFPNTGGSDYSDGWRWVDTIDLDHSKTWSQLRSRWTLALVFNHYSGASGVLNVCRINTTFINLAYVLQYSAAGKLYWTRYPGPVQWNFDMVQPVIDGLDHRVVVAQDFQTDEFRIYHQGQLVGTATSAAAPLYKLGSIFLGGIPAVKEVDCIGGEIGPAFLSLRMWSDAEARRWSADPWIHKRPAAFTPLTAVIGSPDGELLSDLVADGDFFSQLAVDGDFDASLAADGDLSSAFAADGELVADLVGDGELSAKIVSDADFGSVAASEEDFSADEVADGELSGSIAADGELSGDLVADGTLTGELVADGDFFSRPKE